MSRHLARRYSAQLLVTALRAAGFAEVRRPAQRRRAALAVGRWADWAEARLEGFLQRLEWLVRLRGRAEAWARRLAGFGRGLW